MLVPGVRIWRGMPKAVCAIVLSAIRKEVAANAGYIVTVRI